MNVAAALEVSELLADRLLGDLAAPGDLARPVGLGVAHEKLDGETILDDDVRNAVTRLMAELVKGLAAAAEVSDPALSLPAV